MNFITFPKTSLSIAALFVAATSAFANGADEITVNTATELREWLTTKETYDGKTLLLGISPFVVESNPPAVVTPEDDLVLQPIYVVAKDVVLSGSGSAQSIFKTEKAGDTFGLNLVKLSLKNMRVEGSGTGTDNADGRVACLVNGQLALAGDLQFQDRYFVASETTHFGAAGGIVYSSLITDRIDADTSSGTILFSNITSYGKTFTESDSNGNVVTNKLKALGGAIFLTGQMKMAGGNGITFTQNRVISQDSDALGGAIYIANTGKSLGGETGLSYNPNDEKSAWKYGLVVENEVLDFSKNSASGENASGGAIAVSGGALWGKGSVLTLSENSVSGNGKNVFGGAIALVDSAVLNWIASDTQRAGIRLHGNGASGNGEFASLAGGGIYLHSSLAELSGSAEFSSNYLTAEADGASVRGGALALKAEKDAPAKFSLSSLEAESQSFENNSILAKGEIKEELVVDGAVSKNEERVPQALGGAVSIDGGEAKISGAGMLNFSSNSARTLGAKTLSAGGALAVEGGTSKIDFSASNLLMEANSALAEGDCGNAFGGAIYQTAGTLSLKASPGALHFTSNVAQVKKAGEALGGAIALAGGNLNLSANRILVEKNLADATLSSAFPTAEESYAFAAGGAFSQRGGNAQISASSSLVFRENTAQATGGENIFVEARGGAIHLAAGTQEYKFLAQSHGKFSGNLASAVSASHGAIASGGAIFVGQNSQFVANSNLEFRGNFAQASSITPGASSLAGAITAAQGGAVFSAGEFSGSSLSFFENNAEVSSNLGNAQGGALYLAGGTFSAGTLEFEENFTRASLAGTPYGNAQGGAIYQSSGALELSNLRMEGNFAESLASFGGAVYSSGIIRAELGQGEHFIVKGNRAGFESAKTQNAFGGAIYKKGGTLSITGEGSIEISNNSALALLDGGNAFGGFYYAAGSTTRLVGTTNTPVTISQNLARAETNGIALGGALYLAGGTHEFRNVNFLDNRALAERAEGGAIYIDVSGAADTNLILAGNTSLSGNTANGAASGIAVGNALSGNSKSNVSLKISAGAKFTSTIDAAGTPIETRSEVETVKLLDPLNVALNGDAKFSLVKDDAGGDFEWANANKIEVESGEFSASFGKGTTRLKSGFSLTGTTLKTLEVKNGASLIVESGALFPKFESLKIAEQAQVNIQGKAVFDSVTVETLGSASLDFDHGSELEIRGNNLIEGRLSFAGNVNAHGIQAAGENVGVSAKEIFVRSSGNTTASLGFDYTGTGTLSIATETLLFENSAELNLASGVTLALKEIEAGDPENVIDAKILGKGKVIFLDETNATGTIEINPYYDKEKKEYLGFNLSFGEEIILDSGIKLNSNAILELGNTSSVEYKRIISTGGQLLAEGSSESSPLELYDLSVESGGLVLGKKGAGQAFKLVVDPNATEIDEQGNLVPVTTPNKISARSELNLLESTSLFADVELTSTYAARLSGEGRLVGNVSGYGIISIAEIDGNVNISENRRLTFDKTTQVSGEIQNAGTLTLSKGANLASHKLTNTGTWRSEEATFSGEIENQGKLVVSGTLTLDAGSKFTQNPSASTEIRRGGCIDFSQLSANDILLAGTLLIDTSGLGVSSEFDLLVGLPEGELAGVQIFDSAKQTNLTNRIIWDDTRGNYIFLGLNGTPLHSTLYGDLTAENIFRAYDFADAALLRLRTSSLKAPIFGENKRVSKYMAGYLEEQALKRGEIFDAEVAETSQDLEKWLNNAWAQGQYKSVEMSAKGEFSKYSLHSYGILCGSSMGIDEKSEYGFVFGYTNETQKFSEKYSHKIETSAYEFMAYRHAEDDSAYLTLGVTGTYADHNSSRETLSASFDSWQLGAILETGFLFKPSFTSEVRPYLGLQAIYNKTGKAQEKGGANALSIDSDSAVSARASLGIDINFLITDSLEASLKGAGMLDFGPSSYSTSAYDSDGDIEYSISSRERKNFAWEFGGFLNWRLNERLGLYGGYNQIFRNNRNESRITVGANFSF